MRRRRLLWAAATLSLMGLSALLGLFGMARRRRA